MTSHLIKFIRTYSIGRQSRCFYDVLEVGKGATQDEIRGAFIKLSKIHHPDRQKGDLTKFQELSNAYEVLRNVKSREMYDRSRSNEEVRREANPFGRPSPKRPSRPAASSPMYNYDEWLRSHYGETMRRRRREEAARKYANEFQAERSKASRKLLRRQKVEIAVLGFFLALIVFLWPPKR